MATASKTLPWPFATRLANLATNTTLGTATRHDFAAETVQIPETTRTFRSVKVRVTARDAFTVATDLDGIRIGIKLGAVAFDDVDVTLVAANTGDHEEFVYERDVTAYFVTNFGAGASQTCQVGVAFATGVAANVNNITAELLITYDYDNAAATHIKAVEWVIQGHHTTISTVDVEIGTTGGVSNAPANQIPQLTGGGGVLPEAGITIVKAYLRVTAMDNGNAATNFNLSAKLDAGAYDARATLEQTLITSTPYYDIIDLLAAPYSLTTNAAHALIMKSSLAATFECVSAVLVVIYTFTPAGTTRELHSVRVPLDNTRGTIAPTLAATAGDDERYEAVLDIQDPGVITFLGGSGIVALDHTAGVNGLSTALYNSGQAVRVYGHTNVTRSSGHVWTRRCDHDSTTWALARGINRLTVDVRFGGVGVGSELNGYAIVNYTSDVPAAGIGVGNRTVVYSIASNPTEVTSQVIVSAEERLPSFPATPWKVSGALLEVGARMLPSSITCLAAAERGAGEDTGNGWYMSTLTFGNTAELGRRLSVRSLGPWIRDASYKTLGMDLTATRRWRFASATGAANIGFLANLWLTSHQLAFAVAGVVTVGAGPAANGKTVKIFAVNATTLEVELVATTTTGGGTGAFSVNVPDSTRTYFASYVDGTDIGRSADGTPGTSSFNITMGSTADTTPPVVTVISPTPGVAPGAPGGFPADWLSARSTPIILTVTDVAPGLQYLALIATLPGGVEEVVYRRGAFKGKYAALSTVSVIANGFQFSVRHADGWPPGTVTFNVDPIDAAGNLAA